MNLRNIIENKPTKKEDYVLSLMLDIVEDGLLHLQGIARQRSYDQDYPLECCIVYNPRYSPDSYEIWGPQKRETPFTAEESQRAIEAYDLLRTELTDAIFYTVEGKGEEAGEQELSVLINLIDDTDLEQLAQPRDEHLRRIYNPITNQYEDYGPVSLFNPQLHQGKFQSWLLQNSNLVEGRGFSYVPDNFDKEINLEDQPKSIEKQLDELRKRISQLKQEGRIFIISPAYIIYVKKDNSDLDPSTLLNEVLSEAGKKTSFTVDEIIDNKASKID